MTRPMTATIEETERAYASAMEALEVAALPEAQTDEDLFAAWADGFTVRTHDKTVSRTTISVDAYVAKWAAYIAGRAFAHTFTAKQPVVLINLDAYGAPFTDGVSKACADYGTGNLAAYALRAALSGRGAKFAKVAQCKVGDWRIAYIRQSAEQTRKGKDGKTITKPHTDRGMVRISRVRE